MSYRLMRATALVSAIVLTSLPGAACRDVNESGTGANANQKQPASSSTPANTATPQIEMGDDVFRPAVLNISAGTKVTWVNKGSKAHTVVSNDKLFDSGLVNIDGEFSHTFDAPGTYLYHCAPHAKMVGQIVVK